MSLLDAAALVDLDIEYSPVLISETNLLPKRCTKLSRNKYGIRDAGIFANYGNDWWNIDADMIKVCRARFLLQKSIFYQDLIYKSIYPDNFNFRHFSGANISESAWKIESGLIPLYFPDGVFIPDKKNPLHHHIISSYKIFKDFIGVSF